MLYSISGPQHITKLFRINIIGPSLFFVFFTVIYLLTKEDLLSRPLTSLPAKWAIP
jgi:hypothetical protein